MIVYVGRTNGVSSDKNDQDGLGDWPRRLLHVPTMTSFPWQKGNVYNETPCPKYAIISYTWGRWRLKPHERPDVKSISIKGTTWAIPRVNDTIFSVQQFEQALRTCVEAREPRVNLEFVWVDIACINQDEEDPEGALEIGRQAKIFGRATQQFIWLAADDEAQVNLPHPIENIQYLLDAKEPLRKFQALADATLLRRDAYESEEALVADLDYNINFIEDLTQSVKGLVVYPWFSSLWTLQEAFLSFPAIFLDNDGHAVAKSSGFHPRFSDILHSIRMIFQATSSSVHLRSLLQLPKSLEEQTLRRIIERSGLESLSMHDPLALYTQSKNRTTEHELDRIYGIMQVFDVRLGKSALHARPEQRWTLSELETQLGIALIQKYPLLSQLHVHNTIVRKRQAWRVTTASVVPAWGSELPFHYPRGNVKRMQPSLAIKRVDGALYGYFEGRSCNFETFVDAWKNTFAENLDETSPSSFTSVEIALDLTVLFSRTNLQIRWPLWQVPRGKPQLDLANAMLRRFRQKGLNVRVLCLGGYLAPHLTLYGLILLECHDVNVGRWYARLGICTWDVPYTAEHSVPIGEDVITYETPKWKYDAFLAGEGNEWIAHSGVFG